MLCSLCSSLCVIPDLMPLLCVSRAHTGVFFVAVCVCRRTIRCLAKSKQYLNLALSSGFKSSLK